MAEETSTFPTESKTNTTGEVTLNEAKKLFFKTLGDEYCLYGLAATSFILAAVMYTIYHVAYNKYQDIHDAVAMLRQFAIEQDPKFERKSDLEVIELAQNLSNQLIEVTNENEELQGEIDKVTAMLSTWAWYNRHLYYFSKVELTWEESKRQCKRKESYLVSARFPEEQVFLDTEATRLNGGFWIGLRKNPEAKEGLQWFNRQRVGPLFWDVEKGQPTNDGDCVYIGPLCKIKSCWRIAPCDSKKRYICKKLPDPYWFNL
ncbi:C-type lectin domain family 4 member K-like isoform X2 [Sceloporus undulatus]|uniref:C-type lectin domain family 4 member K-like isoform X2 n=1 Tax=Sceloporus undulatus TaxID=8520 RepID=UPI001C4D6671|nr:C-type lectin domain family 4 member K-like isoform X2 [Sceloporus undulatus]XP_042325040.1 C-type lectin domain family 4 member K-like isoform X2 [Sceloporus undulatus]XP_042325041.1 C-type lectin domain family 4 member K-like isoform X2 [Sceloporus undulatus]